MGGLLDILMCCMIFMLVCLHLLKMSMLTVLVPAGLCDNFSEGCFLGAYDLNGVIIELTGTFYLWTFYMLLYLTRFLFLVTQSLLVAVQPCAE